MRTNTISQIGHLIQQLNNELRQEFESLSDGGQYSEEQKQYAFRLLDKNGIRQTAVILDIPKRTIQRWCRQYDIEVNRCPAWVYERAARRQLKKRLTGRIKADNDGIKLSPLKRGQSAIEDLEKQLNRQRSGNKAANDTKNKRSRKIGRVSAVSDDFSDGSDWNIDELPKWNTTDVDWG